MSGALDLKTRWQVGRVHPTPESEPKGWTLRRLCDVAKLESGHTPSRKRPDYWDGDIPWLSLHDSKEIEGKEIFQTQHTVSKLGLDNSSARLLPKGTVALSRTATIGKVAILGREMATSQDFACYICGPDLFNHYLAHLLRGMETEWDRLMAGSTHNTIYMPLCESMQVLVPPLPEQQAIAAALSDADRVVAGLERVSAKKRLIKQGAMQDLLTARRRLPGFSGEWKETRLGQCGKTYGGLAGKSKQDFRVGTDSYIEFLDVINSTAISGGEFPKVRLSAGERQNRVQRNDLLFNGSSETPEEVGLCAAVIADLENTYLNSFCFGYRLFSSDQIDPIFMAALIRSGEGRERIKHLAQGATRYNLSKRALLELAIKLPSYDEQKAIAAVLSDMDAEIQTLESRLVKAREVKEGMMQNLLTGRVRLV
jgi:type I restriction enzyme, S subunit